MANEKKGISGVFTGVLAVVLIIRIIMIMGRDSSSSTHTNWNNTYLLWSIFFLVVIVGSYFWNKNKKDSVKEE